MWHVLGRRSGDSFRHRGDFKCHPRSIVHPDIGHLDRGLNPPTENLCTPFQRFSPGLKNYQLLGCQRVRMLSDRLQRRATAHDQNASHRPEMEDGQLEVGTFWNRLYWPAVFLNSAEGDKSLTLCRHRET